MSEHIDNAPEQEISLDTIVDAEENNLPHRFRDAGFVVSEGLAYAVLFVGVMAAAAAAFTGLGTEVVDRVKEILGL
jgi:hypothetical protein